VVNKSNLQSKTPPRVILTCDNIKEWGYRSIIIDLSNRWRRVVSFTPRPLCLPRKKPPAPIAQEAGLTAESVWMLWRTKKILPLSGIESRVSSFPGSLFKDLIKFLLTLCGVRKSVICADNDAGTSTEKCRLSTTQTRQSLYTFVVSEMLPVCDRRTGHTRGVR
jgi:hypothetical protein